LQQEIEPSLQWRDARVARKPVAQARGCGHELPDRIITLC
jgi:hypothetical protein